MAVSRYVDPRIPARATTLNSTIDPGTVSAPRVPTRAARGGFRAAGFGRDPDLMDPAAPLIQTSSSLEEQKPPAVSSTLQAEQIAGDGNVGANSPSEGPDADGPDGIGNMDMMDVANVVSMGIPGPIGLVATVANQMFNPKSATQQFFNPTPPPPPMNKPAAEAEDVSPDGLDPAEGATTVSATQASDPGQVQSPGDEGAEATAAEAAGTGTGAATAGDGTADAAAAAGEAAAADAAASGNDGTSGVWHEGGILPDDMDGMVEEIPGQTMLEGEAVLTREATEALGGEDVVSMLNMLPTLGIQERRDLMARISEAIMSPQLEPMEDEMGGEMASMQPSPVSGSFSGGGMMTAAPAPGGVSPMGGPEAAMPPTMPPMAPRRPPAAKSPMANLWPM